MRSLMVVLVAIGVGAVALAATPPDELRGTLHVRGATIVDPPAGEPQGTHAAFVIEGPAAKALYEAIRATPERDACLGDGSLRKRAGNLACVRSAADGTYECNFAIDLATQKVEAGRAC